MSSKELAAPFEELDAMPTVHEDIDETGMALGTGRELYGILTVWWD